MAESYDELTDPVAKKHDDIANGSMGTLRAIYNHSRKTNRALRADNPVNAIDWNCEKRRNSAMGIGDLKGWFAELAMIDDPDVLPRASSGPWWRSDGAEAQRQG